MKSQGVKIRPRIANVKGRSYTYYVADFGLIDGKRQTRQFKTEEEAEEYAKKVGRERRRFGDEAFKLTAEQRTDAAEAIAILEGKKYGRTPNFPLKSLRAAALFYMEHTNPDGGNRTMRELLDEFLESRREKGLRAATIESYGTHLGHVAEYFGDTPVCEITTKAIEAWFRTKKYGAVSRISYLRHLHSLFNFAIMREHVHSNPVARIEKPRKDKIVVDYLTADQAENVLRAAEEHVPSLVPYLAISMFAGLRPSEIHGNRTEHEPLDWCNINLVRSVIRVTPEQDKNREGRRVEVSENLRSWLLPRMQKSGPIYFSRKGMAKAFKEAGAKYSKDILRHSFGTQHWAMHRHEGETAIQLGDTIATVKRHYVNTDAEKADAKQFWKIEPTLTVQPMKLTKTA
jgi:site-specific recombinase XerC